MGGVCLPMGVNLDRKCGGALTMASMECNPIMGVWRQSPQHVLGAEPWLRSGGHVHLDNSGRFHQKSSKNWSNHHVVLASVWKQRKCDKFRVCPFVRLGLNLENQMLKLHQYLSLIHISEPTRPY